MKTKPNTPINQVQWLDFQKHHQKLKEIFSNWELGLKIMKSEGAPFDHEPHVTDESICRRHRQLLN